MKHLFAAFAILAVAPACAVASAQTVTAEAVVAWKAQPQDQIIVGETLWNCSASRCAGKLIDHPTTRLHSCRRLSVQAGRIVEFRTPGGGLDAEQLARCNRDR